jgi:hypothetical protein
MKNCEPLPLGPAFYLGVRGGYGEKEGVGKGDVMRKEDNGGMRNEVLTAMDRSPASVCFRVKFSSAKVLVP